MSPPSYRVVSLQENNTVAGAEVLAVQAHALLRRIARIRDALVVPVAQLAAKSVALIDASACQNLAIKIFCQILPNEEVARILSNRPVFGCIGIDFASRYSFCVIPGLKEQFQWNLGADRTFPGLQRGRDFTCLPRVASGAARFRRGQPSSRLDLTPS